MTQHNDGGPAFPHDVFVKDGQGVSHLTERHFGMSLRDYFAGQAMTAASMYQTISPEELARDAYRIADAMLEARKVQP